MAHDQLVCPLIFWTDLVAVAFLNLKTAGFHDPGSKSIDFTYFLAA
jgi:hypothetical protein